MCLYLHGGHLTILHRDISLTVQVVHFYVNE